MNRSEQEWHDQELDRAVVRETMTREQFDALLRRRDEKQREHESACLALEEEPSPWARKRCYRLYDELAAIQAQIDDELAAERAAEK